MAKIEAEMSKVYCSSALDDYDKLMFHRLMLQRITDYELGQLAGPRDRIS